MARTAEDYRDQMLALQPPGSALPTDRNSTWANILLAFGDELARAEASAEQIIEETDPRTISALLTDWERAYGLPDSCVTTEQTTDQRREAVVARYTHRGDQSRAAFIALAAKLGYTITITEFRPHTCEHDCEHPVYDDPWAYAWQVNAPLETVRESTCESSCEDPLRAWGNELLECAIRRQAQAHNTVIFSYS